MATIYKATSLDPASAKALEEAMSPDGGCSSAIARSDLARERQWSADLWSVLSSAAEESPESTDDAKQQKTTAEINYRRADRMANTACSPFEALRPHSALKR